jgi:hypothetical protein
MAALFAPKHPAVPLGPAAAAAAAAAAVLPAAQVIRTGAAAAGLSQPPGILWHKLSRQKLGQIRVLQQLREQIEQETGQALPYGGLLSGTYVSCHVTNTAHCRCLRQPQEVDTLKAGAFCS